MSSSAAAGQTKYFFCGWLKQPEKTCAMTTTPDELEASSGSRAFMMRSSSHSDLNSSTVALNISRPGPERKDGPDTESRPHENPPIENLTMSWPPPGFVGSFSSVRQNEELQMKNTAQARCYIPSPEQDDYGRQLKSRLAIQRLAPTGWYSEPRFLHF